MKLLGSLVLLTLLGLSYSQSCDNVEVQTLTLEEVEDGLSAQWSTNSNEECDYSVTFSSNVPGASDSTITTSDTQYTFNDVVPCSTITVTVVRVGGSEAVSATITTEITVKQAPVLKEMITSCNSIQMIWEAQPYNENMCEVTHFQMFCLSDTHNFTIPQAVTDVEHRTFDILITVLRPDIYYSCNGFMFTTLGGFSTPSETISFWSNLDMIRDLEVEETETSIKASWEPPLNSEECGVAYEVTYENEVLGSASVEVVGLSHDLGIELIPCTDYTITVTPISFTGSKGTGVSAGFTPSIRVGEVSDLAIVDNVNILIAQWTPLNVGTCGVTYTIQQFVDNELHFIFQTNNVAFAIERITCATTTFTVQATSEGVTGGIASQEIELGVGDITSIGEVTNVRLDDNVISWDAPVSIGFCSISYIVETENIFGVEVQEVSDTAVDVDLIPCSANQVTVTGVSGDVTGATGRFEIEAPIAEFSAPIHVRTEPGVTNAQITLQADSIVNNLCVVAAAVVECSNDNDDSFTRVLDVDDDESREYSIDIDGLQTDTIYTCEARWEGSSSRTEFSFRTNVLSSNALEISDISDDRFTISWYENYGKQFVNGYTVIVESLGPLHATPNGCENDRGERYQFDLDNTELRVVFTRGSANYGYKVSLSTSYNLGVTLDEQVDTQTETGVPDSPENLNVELVLNEENRYNYSAILNWNTPCNLRGRLDEYSLNINARFYLNGAAIGVAVGDEISVDEAVVENAYSYEITDINPFFGYDISIYTVAAGVSVPAEISFNAPDVCSCQN